MGKQVKKDSTDGAKKKTKHSKLSICKKTKCIVDMPNFILIKIFRNINIGEVINARSVCSRFQCTYDSAMLVNFKTSASTSKWLRPQLSSKFTSAIYTVSKIIL